MRYTPAIGYLVLMASWIYWLDAGNEDSGWTIVPLTAAQVALGFVLGRWWAVALPVALPLIALPAGLPESEYSEPAPLWFGMAYAAALSIPLVLLGVVARKRIGGLGWRRSRLLSSRR